MNDNDGRTIGGGECMLIKQDFYFHALNAHRPLHIRVPDWGEPPFPVMYFFDGHNLFSDADATYGKSWGLDEYCAAWDKPMIIVGLECSHEGDERLSEYLHGPLSDARFLELVQRLSDETRSEVPRDYQRWNKSLKDWQHEIDVYLIGSTQYPGGHAGAFARSARSIFGMTDEEWERWFADLVPQ